MNQSYFKWNSASLLVVYGYRRDGSAGNCEWSISAWIWCCVPQFTFSVIKFAIFAFHQSVTKQLFAVLLSFWFERLANHETHGNLGHQRGRHVVKKMNGNRVSLFRVVTRLGVSRGKKKWGTRCEHFSQSSSAFAGHFSIICLTRGVLRSRSSCGKYQRIGRTQSCESYYKT